MKDQFLFKLAPLSITVSDKLDIQLILTKISLIITSYHGSLLGKNLHLHTNPTNSCNAEIHKFTSSYKLTVSSSTDANTDRNIEINYTQAEFQTVTLNVAVRTTSITESDATRIVLNP